MVDSGWDNGGVAPRKNKGMPVWGKVLVGCGVAVLLLLGSCVGVAWWGMGKLSEKADQAWAEMDQTVRSLKTEQGTKALYQANPGLADSYPNEEDFLKAAEGWRGKLGEFPARRPSIRDLVEEKNGAGHLNIDSRNATTRIEYQIPKGGRLHLVMESGRVTDLRVE